MIQVAQSQVTAGKHWEYAFLRQLVADSRDTRAVDCMETVEVHRELDDNAGAVSTFHLTMMRVVDVEILGLLIFHS